MDIIGKAKSFAKGAYAARRSARPGSDAFAHPTAVAHLVWQATLNETVTAAAFLHDITRDAEVAIEVLLEEFGYTVSSLVFEVADQSSVRDGSRTHRQSLHRAHVARASAFGQSIAVADLIDATTGRMTREPSKASIILDEMRSFLDVLPRASPLLIGKAKDVMAGHTPALAA